MAADSLCLAPLYDCKGGKIRRLYELYKAQRPEPPEELRPQFALVRDATAAFGVPAIELPDWEADDLIASYARAAEAAGGSGRLKSFKFSYHFRFSFAPGWRPG